MLSLTVIYANNWWFINHVNLFQTTLLLINTQLNNRLVYIFHCASKLYIIIVYNVCIFLQLTKLLRCIIFCELEQTQ